MGNAYGVSMKSIKTRNIITPLLLLAVLFLLTGCQNPEPTATPSPTLTQTPTKTSTTTPTLAPTQTSTATITRTSTATSTSPPTNTATASPTYPNVDHLVEEAQKALLEDPASSDGYDLLDEAMEINPYSVAALILRGLTYAQMGSLERGLADLTRAVEIDSENAIAYYDRGLIHSWMNHSESAIEDFDQAIELDPEFYDAYSDRGFEYMKLDQIDLALADFNSALAINPDYPLALTNRGLVYIWQDNLDLAFEDLNRAIELIPDGFEPYINRGLAYQNSGNFDQALKDYNKGLEINPYSKEGHNNRASLYLELGQLEEALPDIDFVVSVAYYADSPQYWQLLYSRAEIYFELKKYSLARVDLEEIIRNGKNTDEREKAKSLLSTIPTMSIEEMLEIYPLAEGKEFVYKAKYDYVTEITDDYQYIYDSWTGFTQLQILSAEVVEDMAIFSLRYANYPYYYSFQDEEFKTGEILESLTFQNGIVTDKNGFIDYYFPLDIGLQWIGLGEDFPEYRWYVDTIEDVITPAGYFQDCYKLSLWTRPDSSYIWFKPGIGIVKYYAFHHPADWSYELTLYTINEGVEFEE